MESRPASTPGVVANALLLGLWMLILLHDLIVDPPNDLLSGLKMILSFALLTVVALSIVGPAAVRARLKARLGATGRVWLTVMFLLGITIFAAEFVTALAAPSSGLAVAYALFGTVVGVTGLGFTILDVVRKAPHVRD